MSEARAATNAQSAYERSVNPQWVRLLDVLGMNVRYTNCLGSELFTSDGARILDFNSGYCVHNVGHNNPGVIRAFKSELDRNGPAMLQGHVPELAGELADRLCMRAGGQLSKVFSAVRELKASNRQSNLRGHTPIGRESSTQAEVFTALRAARFRSWTILPGLRVRSDASGYASHSIRRHSATGRAAREQALCGLRDWAYPGGSRRRDSSRELPQGSATAMPEAWNLVGAGRGADRNVPHWAVFGRASLRG